MSSQQPSFSYSIFQSPNLPPQVSAISSSLSSINPLVHSPFSRPNQSIVDSSFPSSSLQYTSSSPALLTSNISHVVTTNLDSKNYLLQKSQFTLVLIDHDLLGYVDRSFHPPQNLS
ncbi:hypothetical protein ACH5RR_032507 [Cinchona calisaya]|uniref:Uncharacterized protein n=1 Tax=Cinchona calisaya TaxID=153742 RepID=A0ABD2YIA3_9GENT